jgi:hypothetical protein
MRGCFDLRAMEAAEFRKDLSIDDARYDLRRRMGGEPVRSPLGFSQTSTESLA